MIEHLTDEAAALIWSGDTSSLANLQETTPPVTENEIIVGDDKPTTLEEPEVKTPLDTDLDKIFHEPSDEDDDEDEPEEKPTVSAEPKSKGRKPAELVSLVNQLVEEEVLSGFEEGEVKTIDEAKELIKLNLQSKEKVSKETWWDEEVKTYSPQVQAILHYAKQGGQDVMPLLNSIAQVEQVADLDVDTEAGQEEIVRQTLKVKGFDDEEIADQITTFKDLDKLKVKAEKFLPELNNMKTQHVQMLMAEQEKRQQQAENASRVYLKTITDTLEKDTVGGIKLQREDKAKIYQALAAPTEISLSGGRTNSFVKALENLQFGDKADYEHFLNIVHHAIDREGFLAKMAQGVKNETNADNIRKLKTAKTSTANTEENFETGTPVKKNTIQKQGFKNPFQ